jgi:hypothetical protein
VDAESGPELAETADDDEEMEIDGDATVLVTPGDLPAGTEHLTQQTAKR